MSLTYRQFYWQPGGADAGTHPFPFAELAVVDGNSLVLAICSSAPVIGVTDNKGNSWVRDAKSEMPGATASIWRVSDCRGGSGFIAAIQLGASGTCDIFGHEVEAILAPFQLFSDRVGIVSGSGTSISPGVGSAPGFQTIAWAALAMNMATAHTHVTPAGWSNSRSDYIERESTDIVSSVFSSGTYQPTWFCDVVGAVFATVMATYYETLDCQFVGNPQVGTSPLNVTFTDQTRGGPTRWRWHFGDGQESDSQNPTHQYAAAGNYTVTLFVSREPVAFDNLTKTGYIRVDGSTDPPTGPPGPQGAPGNEGTGIPPGLLWALGSGYWPMLGYPNQPIPYGDPPPAETPAEVEQDILEQGLLDALAQVLSAAQGSGDLPTMEAAIRQVTGYLDGLIIANVLQQTDMSDYEMVTQGFADQDEPTSSDAGFDGDVWVASPSAFRSRRQRMPADLERAEELATIWICALDEDGVPVWFQIETYPPPWLDGSVSYPPGWSRQGVTGEF